MLRRSLDRLAFAASALLAATMPSLAGGWHCGWEVPCLPPPPAYVLTFAPVFLTYAPVPVYVPTYVVDQGPVYTGPGIITLPHYEWAAEPVGYPYVGPYYYLPHRRHAPHRTVVRDPK
jgi:hypothetical protein